MNPRAVRRAFYDRLIAAVADGVPSRRSMTSGIAWRSGVADVYHHVLVLPYVGSFEYPERQDWRSWTLGGPPIPRIHLNHIMFFPSHAQELRWSAAGAPPHGLWRGSDHVLELTVALEELPDFAPWIVAWTHAADIRSAALLPTLPYPLQFPRTAEELLKTSYEWTLEASEQYERRRPKEVTR
jgi:hypothetical protein